MPPIEARVKDLLDETRLVDAGCAASARIAVSRGILGRLSSSSQVVSGARLCRAAADPRDRRITARHAIIPSDCREGPRHFALYLARNPRATGGTAIARTGAWYRRGDRPRRGCRCLARGTCGRRFRACGHRGLARGSDVRGQMPRTKGRSHGGQGANTGSTHRSGAHGTARRSAGRTGAVRLPGDRRADRSFRRTEHGISSDPRGKHGFCRDRHCAADRAGFLPSHSCRRKRRGERASLYRHDDVAGGRARRARSRRRGLRYRQYWCPAMSLWRSC